MLAMNDAATMIGHPAASGPANVAPPRYGPELRAAIRIVLADGHPVTLTGLEQLFHAAGFQVVARCTDGDEALKAVKRCRPDIFVTELILPRRDGIRVIRELRRNDSKTKVVVLTSGVDEHRLAEVLPLGIDGVLLKDMPTHLLSECINKVYSGARWVEKQSAGRMLEQLLRKEIATRQLSRDLTPRELEVVRFVAAGHKSKVIAERLFVKEATIKVHLHNIYKKLHVDSRVALTLYAQKKGFV
jgi:two-component system, NarL family, nitrate/nitrite response regulator NarL